MSHTKEQEPENVAAEEIARLFGVQTKTIRKWTAERKIPFVRLSPRCTRYNVAACRAWLEQHAVEPSQPESKL